MESPPPNFYRESFFKSTLSGLVVGDRVYVLIGDERSHISSYPLSECTLDGKIGTLVYIVSPTLATVLLDNYGGSYTLTESQIRLTLSQEIVNACKKT